MAEGSDDQGDAKIAREGDEHHTAATTVSEEEEEEEDESEESEAEDGGDDESEDEPKLKYARLTSHLGPIYRNGDAASTFLVAGDKMVCSEALILYTILTNNRSLGHTTAIL